MPTDDRHQLPSEVPAASQQSPKQVRIARNIRAICLLYLIFGSIFTLVGIGAIFSGDTGDSMPRVVPYVLFLCGLGGVLSAIGVLKRRKWGVPLCLAMSGLYLLVIPIGTILGGYFLLNIDSVKQQFR